MTSALPSKLFFRIGEVANLVGVEPHVLRYWEREFRSIRPTKSAKGQRVYARKDVENLLRIRDLLYRDGFTIAGAKKRLQRSPVTPADGTEPHRSEGHFRSESERDRAQTHSLPVGSRPLAPIVHVQAEGDELAAASGPRPRDESAQRDRQHHPPEEGPASDVAPAHATLAGDPSALRIDAAVHGKLTALRAEVEAFLHELETSP